MKSVLYRRFFILVLPLALMVQGCAASDPEPLPAAPVCILPSGHLVEPAFSTARATLSKHQCRHQFDAVFDSLLKVCEGDPSLENKEKFSTFLLWAKKEGIISKKQASRKYTRYFSTRFVSLPENYQTCSYCSRLKELMGQCRDELRQKEMGLLTVCEDKPAFAKASGDLANIELILEATCSACGDE